MASNPFAYNPPDIGGQLAGLLHWKTMQEHQQGQLALAEQQQKYAQARQHTDDEIKAADAAHAMLERGHSPQQAEQTYKAMTKHIPDASPFKVKFPSPELGPVPHSLVEITHGNGTYVFDREAKGRAMAEMERERLARLSGAPSQAPLSGVGGQMPPVADAQLGLRSMSDIAKGGPDVSQYLMSPDDRDVAETLLRNNAYSYGRGRLVPPPTDPSAGSMARDPELAAILAPRQHGAPSGTAEAINRGALSPHEAAAALTADIGHLGTLESHRIMAQNALDKINLEASYGAFKRKGGGGGGSSLKDAQLLFAGSHQISQDLPELERERAALVARMRGRKETHEIPVKDLTGKIIGTKPMVRDVPPELAAGSPEHTAAAKRIEAIDAEVSDARDRMRDMRNQALDIIAGRRGGGKATSGPVKAPPKVATVNFDEGDIVTASAAEDPLAEARMANAADRDAQIAIGKVKGSANPEAAFRTFMGGQALNDRAKARLQVLFKQHQKTEDAAREARFLAERGI